MTFIGRRSERAVLTELVALARDGQSGCVRLVGDAGIGKSALLDLIEESASDLLIVRASGTQVELSISLAAVYQICSPLLSHLRKLPEPQRDALSIAFGLKNGPVPNHFMLGLGVLGLLAEASRRRPVLCLFDDVQWFDRASRDILGFVCRRLSREGVAVIVAAREQSDLDEFDGSPMVKLEGLAETEASQLLEEVVPGRLDSRTRRRLIAETGGNPLALIELLDDLSPAELAVGLLIESDSTPLITRIENNFRRRFRELPSQTKRLLLLYSADDTGDPELLAKASATLSLSEASLQPALQSNLIRSVNPIVFRHPVVRSMVYSNATSTERLQVHRALAEATDPRKDPQRRVWHEALAFNEPDEQLATRLESAASGCRSRGGIAEGAALIRRAADVSPDRQVRNRRLLEAAECYELAGAPIAALDALGEIDTPTLSGREQARLDRLRAHLAFSVERGRESAELLVASAERLQTLDPVLARETYLEALWGATISGRFADAGTITRVAKAVLRWQHESPKDSAALGDLLLSGMCFLLTDGYASGAAPLKAALQRFRELGVGESLEMSWSWVAIELWDDEAWHEITNAQVSRARATEAVMGLPLLLNFLAGFLIFAGELQSGSLLIEEGDYVADVIGQPRPLYVALSLAAVRGDEDEVNRLSNAARKEGEQRGEGLSISTAEYYSAMLNNSLSRYEEAFALALSVVSRETLGISSWALFELVEASSRIGRQDEGLRALDILAEQASAADTNWVNGTYLGARALLSQPIDADRLFLEALTLLAKSRMRLQHARTDLLYGEWLRRQRRRSEARIHLRSAYDSFEAMGALAFAARAQRELAAAGSYVSLSMSQEQTILTPQETQVARLAAEGLSNGEIASRLFLSRRTIEYHLNKVYQKLGISSRRGLMRSIFVG